MVLFKINDSITVTEIVKNRARQLDNNINRIQARKDR